MAMYLDLENRFGETGDIWLALSDLQKGSDINVLSQHEHRTYRQIEHENRRKEFLEARAVIRDMASRAGVDVSNFELKKNVRGRPFGETDTETLQVSIAHTDTYVLCGLSRSRLIGVDLEPVDRKVHFKLRKRIFTEQEKVNSRLEDVETLRIWTIKESIVKLTGEGLGRHLSELSIDKVDDTHFEATVNGVGEVGVYSWKQMDHWIAVAMYQQLKAESK